MLQRIAGPATAVAYRARRAVARRQRPPAPPVALATVPLAAMPVERAAELRQPDDTSCGAAALVFSRLLLDEELATTLLADPVRWRTEVLAMHRRLAGPRDHDGRWQWPWPRVVGTSPWAVVRQLGGGPGRSGRGGRYAVRVLDPDDLGAEFDRVLAAAGAGHTVPLYVGDTLHPAHVVLVIEPAGDRLRIYEPSAGRIVRIGREAFAASRFGLGGWTVPWFAVLPR